MTNMPETIIETVEKKSFWISERIIFVGTLVLFVLFAIGMYLTELHNPKVLNHNFLDYLFDSVSVGTLTGLFRGDSGNFTFWGQFILLLDMVLNGLIASVISVLLIIFIRLGFDRTNSLRYELERLQLNSRNIILFILFDFAFILGLGAVLFRFTGGRNLWEDIFNSASHILNDGVAALPNNMIPYAHDITMLLSGAFLIAIGGLGIGIRGHVYRKFLQLLRLQKLAAIIPDSLLAPRKYIIVILILTFGLQILGAIAMYVLDGNNHAIFDSSFSPVTKFVDMYYMSVSARTAGFTVFPDLSLLHDTTAYILILLMSIGAASSSFAGGILKLTAFLYIFIYLISKFEGKKDCVTPHSHVHLSEKTVLESNFRIMGFGLIVMCCIIILFFLQQNLSGLWIIFESISAVSNTGLSLGATNLLSDAGMIVMILLMTVGKIGFITTIISFFPKLQNLLSSAESDYDEFPVD